MNYENHNGRFAHTERWARHCRGIDCDKTDCLLRYAYEELKELKIDDNGIVVWNHCADEYLSYTPVKISPRIPEHQ